MSNKSILQSNNDALSANNLDLQSLIDQANALPEAVNIDEELNAQDSLIEQIQAALIGKVAGGESGDGYAEADSLITDNFSTYTNNRVSSIGQGAFAYASKLQSIDFPNVKIINSSAFKSCSNLTTINFPVCTTIRHYAFCFCNSLTIASFPACTTIGSNAFSWCSKLTTASFPVCTTISDNAFGSCSNLTTINFPVCKTIRNVAFGYCYNLTTANFPACTTIGSNAFYHCSNLTTINFPVCTIIYPQAFAYCKSLITASFPVCTTIGSYAFNVCYNLKSLYLTNSVVCTLSNSNAFASTPIGGYSASAGTYGSIYVPASLLTTYQTATNWTYFSSRFVAYDSGANSNGGADN